MDFEKALIIEFNLISDIANKIYPVVAPKNTANPYMIYTLTGTDREESLTGYEGLIGLTYQLDVYNSSHVGVKTIMESIISKLETFNNRNIAGTGPYCQQLQIINQFEIYENMTNKYKGVIEFKVFYEEE